MTIQVNIILSFHLRICICKNYWYCCCFGFFDCLSLLCYSIIDTDGELEEEETVKVGNREIPLSEVTDEDRQQMNSEEYKVPFYISNILLYSSIFSICLPNFSYHQFLCILMIHRFIGTNIKRLSTALSE